MQNTLACDESNELQLSPTISLLRGYICPYYVLNIIVVNYHDFLLWLIVLNSHKQGNVEATSC